VILLICSRKSIRNRLSSGFSLLEIFVVLAMMGGLLTTTLITFEGVMERWHLNIATDQVVQTLKHAQFLALTQQRSHKIVGSGTQLWIKKRGEPLEETSWESLPADFVVTANSWPSFSPYGFASRGTISLKSPHYSTEIIVSTLGSIRHTDIQHK